MRSLPSVIRSLAGMPVPRRDPAVEPSAIRPVPRSVSREDDRGAAQRELERVEALLRRYHGHARIENPFSAFPTRSFWLGRLMRDDA